MTSGATATAFAPARGLETISDARLFAPDLQPTPFPVRRIQPSPCTLACPAGIQVKAYVSLIAEEKFGEALEVVRRRCPLPGICGRICHHPCELACRRGEADEPIAIRALKRYVADVAREHPLPKPPPGPDRPERVAIIGSGPAGLTAAYDLRLNGFPVTVFESASEPGGMLRYGITAYRLPRDILSEEIDVLLRAGVEIRSGMRLGVDMDLEELHKGEYRAVLLAIGAQNGRPLEIPGARGRPEVKDALAFLRRVNAGDQTPIGKRVLVVGGGSTAVEAARTARRLGARTVEILYRRSREEMPASPEEIDAANFEGVRFRYLVAPSRVLSEGDRFLGLECVQVGLGERDRGGRRQPIAIPGTEFRLKADQVLTALGQEVDLGFLPSRGRTRFVREARLVVDPKTSMTPLARVFAAGDMVSGPSTVIDAIAEGHRAAESIRHLLLEGRPGIWEERPESFAPVEYELPDAPPVVAKRIHPATVAPLPGREFAEVEQRFTRREAIAEARRCLRCGPCGECRTCASTCQRRHIMVRTDKKPSRGATALLRVPAGVSLALEVERPGRGWVLPPSPEGIHHVVDPSAGLEVELLPVRSLVRHERCRGCALCTRACPFGAVAVVDPSGSDPRARIEPSLCRGCNLCTAVCPTRAAVSSALSPEWWGDRIGDALAAFDLSPQAKNYVVLACQKRAGALEPVFERAGIHVEVIRLRCVGQVDSGMLLELLDGERGRVLVAGCDMERCRFGAGAYLACEQIQCARAILQSMGRDPMSIITDWSPGRAHDRLEDPILRLVRSSGLEGPEGVPVA